MIIGNYIGIGNSQQGEEAPDLSDALFHLNGVIEQNGSDYYFTDYSGNGRDFLITNKDFPSDWTVGFPYKSKATISAPADDAVLIAADVNNYLYDSGGTPNQISVVSLFQDIDYVHKIFCRHRDQVLDENEEEVIAPRVAEIVMYNSARTGTSLTACQSYFSVPTEALTNVKWVTKTGDDTTGTGSKAAPWKTLAKATQSATNGDTVYVTTGDYLENHNATNGYWMITKAVTVVGLGRVNVTSNNTTVASNINAAVTVNVSHVVIGNPVASSNATILSGAASNITYNKCWIKNGVIGIGATSAVSITAQDCIYSGITSRFLNTTNAAVVVKGCKSTDNVPVDLNAGTALRTATYQYNDLLNGSVTNGYAVNCNISYNTLGRLAVAGDADVTSSSSSLRITRNKISSATVLTEIDVDNNYYDTEISYNTLTAQVTGAMITCADTNTLVIKGNELKGENGLYAKILCQATTATVKTITIEDNAIFSNGNNHPIQVGDEVSTTGYHTYSGTIRRNNCIGSGDASLAHGISVFNQSGISIQHCYVKGYTFGAIVKVAGVDLSSAPIGYCIFENCGSGVSAKGGLNQLLHNLTIINATGQGVFIAVHETETTLGTVLRNCIIYENGAASSYRAVRVDTTCDLDSDNNVIYSLNNSNKFNVNGGGSDITLTDWQALGRDTNSIFTDPSLDSDYVPSSPIIIGENLGDDYKSGLDVTTNWGSSSAVPVVVTRDQQAVGDWEVGAYVQR